MEDHLKLERLHISGRISSYIKTLMEEVLQHLPYLRTLTYKVRFPYFMALLKKSQVPCLPFEGLPFEVILEILSRLPIESLIRFKIVCKSWCNLINDPLFIELQLRRSKSRPRLMDYVFRGNQNWRVIMDTYLLDVAENRGRTMCKARKISLKYKWRKDNFEIYDAHIIGSCNGLICKISAFPHGCCGLCHCICVCNPITKECVVLPLRSGLTYIDSGIFGFGVDSTGKYKVIQIFYEGGMWKGEIITLGQSDSWRQLEFPYQLHQSTNQTITGMLFMDGVLYCMIREPINQQQSILIFDIHDEKFSTIELPPSMKFPYSRDLVLTVLKDSLVLYQQRRSFGVSLWMIEINKSKDGLSVYRSMDVPWPNLVEEHFFDMVGLVSNNMLLIDICRLYLSYRFVYCVEKNQLFPVTGEPLTSPALTKVKTLTLVPSLISPILVACGKAKKEDTWSEFLGLDLKVVGYSSLSEFMDSYWLQPSIKKRPGFCIDCGGLA